MTAAALFALIAPTLLAAEPQDVTDEASDATRPALSARGALSNLALQDPAHSRVWLSPTALVGSPGSLTLHDQELGFVSASYVVRAGWEVAGLAFAAGPPLGSGIYRASTRIQVVDLGRVAVAAFADVLYASDDYDDWVVPDVGAVASFCLSATCRSYASLAAATAYTLNLSTDSAVATAWDLMAAASLNFELVPNVRALFEIDRGFDTLVGWYGVRVYGASVSVDLGLFVGSDLLFGMPWLSLSVRPW